jgi:hypothetical protein
MIKTIVSGAANILAGLGLTKTGNTLDVGDVNKGVQVNADDLEIDTSEIAGNGLKQNGVNSYILDVEPNDFAGNGVEDDGFDNLRVKVNTIGGANLAKAISVVANGVAVKVDDSSIQGNGSNQLEVKDGGITTAKLASNINASIKISADNQDPSGGLTADSIAVASYSTAEWLLTIISSTTSTNRYSCKVTALNNGVTGIISVIYAEILVGSVISGLSVTVDISGGNMRLRITASENIDYRVSRIALTG